MQCMTVSYGKVSGKARKYRYWQPAIYETRMARDGRTLWSYVGHRGTARRSERLAIDDALALARSMGVEYRRGVRHNMEIKDEVVA